MNRTARVNVYTLTLLLTLLLALIPNVPRSYAQSDTLPGKLILTYLGPLNFGRWELDDKLVGVMLDNYKSEYVDIVTGNFVEYSPSPAPRIQLTAIELSAFGIESDPNSRASGYEISPDGEYVAYSVLIPADQDIEFCSLRQLRLANRRTKVIFDLPFIVRLPETFDWIKNSQGLIIGTSDGCDGPGGAGVLAYVSNLSPMFDDLSIVQFAEIPQLQMDLGQLHVSVSEDGQSLLAAVLPYYSGQGARLVLVNVTNPNQSRIIADNIDGFLTANLIAQTPATILMLSASGLTELNLAGRQTVLDSRLTTTGVTYDCSSENIVMEASISPSGRWLAYTHCEPHDGITSLYLLDLYALRHPKRPTPTVAPTFTPIGS